MPEQAPYGRLGALIRRRYKERGLTIPQLVEQTGISQSTIHRIINATDVDIVSKPENVASLSIAAGLTEDDVRDTVQNEDLRQSILRRMDTAKAVGLRDYNRARMSGPARADLIIISPDGVTGKVSFEATGETLQDVVLKLGDVLRDAGWIAALPLESADFPT